MEDSGGDRSSRGGGCGTGEEGRERRAEQEKGAGRKSQAAESWRRKETASRSIPTTESTQSHRARPKESRAGEEYEC